MRLYEAFEQALTEAALPKGVELLPLQGGLAVEFNGKSIGTIIGFVGSWVGLVVHGNPKDPQTKREVVGYFPKGAAGRQQAVEAILAASPQVQAHTELSLGEALQTKDLGREAQYKGYRVSRVKLGQQVSAMVRTHEGDVVGFVDIAANGLTAYAEEDGGRVKLGSAPAKELVKALDLVVAAHQGKPADKEMKRGEA